MATLPWRHSWPRLHVNRACRRRVRSRTARHSRARSTALRYHDGEGALLALEASVTKHARRVEKVFAVTRRATHHRFQVLTKRAERLESFAKSHVPSPNVWLGVSVENADYTGRVDHLRRAPARVRFLSIEPLLGPIPDLDLRGIEWVIAGGESGGKSRPMNPEWVRDIRDRCRASRIPFFFKQWGGFQKKKNGRTLDGRTWDEMPRAAAG